MSGSRKPARPRKAAAKRSAQARPARPRRRLPRLPRLGARSFVVALMALVIAIGTMAIGPLQGYTAAAERVDALEAERDQLVAEVARLEDRRERLLDPAEIELLARTELGLVKPGEIPYVVVTPDDGEAQVRPRPSEPEAPGEPWYRRFGDAVAHLFADL